VLDGGFEANTNARTNTNWTSIATTFGSPLCNTGNCGPLGQTGNGFVLFDGAANGNSAEAATVQQIVTIPAGTMATLTYSVRAAVVTSPSNSNLTVTLDGAVVQTINEPAVADSEYSQIVVDLSAFADGVPRVLSFNYNRPAGTTGSDIFLLDDVTLATSCGFSVTVSGKVTTPLGLPLRNAVVSLIDSQNVRRTAITSSFGLYSFDNVNAGETHIMSVASKRYRFAPKVLSFNASAGNVDFIGLE